MDSHAPSTARRKRAGGHARDQHEADQYERRRPGLRVVLRVGRLRVLEDLERHRRERLVRVPLEPVADDRRREEERRRLAGDAGDGERRPGDDAADRLRQHHPERRSPAADAEPERGLARRLRHERQHLLRRARDQRDHQDRERERARQGALAVVEDDQREDEDPYDDRRHAVQDVERERDQERDARARELVQVDRREDADRDSDGRREPDDHDRSDEGVREAARLVREAERVRRLREQVPVDRGSAPPGDRHEDERGRDPRARVGQDDAADHLPARRPERQRALLQVARDAEEELPRDARDDRRDHDRQDEDRGQEPEDRRVAAEERQEAERALQPRLEVIGDERPHDEDPPEADDDARNRGEHLDERADRAAKPAWRELGEEERDRDRERSRDQERPDGRDGAAEQERRRAEDLVDARVPRVRDEEVEPEAVDRRARLVDDLPGDEDEQRDRGRGGREGDAVQGGVTEVEAPAPPELGGAGGRRFGDEGQAWTRFRVFSEAPKTLFGMGTKRSLGPYCCPPVSAQKTNLRRSAALLVLS